MRILALALALTLDPAEPQQEPMSLRRLYREAEIVIVGKPGESVQMELTDENLSGSSRVTLSVEKVLKGKVDGKEVEVRYAQNLACPDPARYPRGKTILTFLVWQKRWKAYMPLGMSFGTKELDDAGLAATAARLQELAAIPEEKPAEDLSDATIEWLVRCIEQPATRKEGAVEILLKEPEHRTEGEPRWVPVRRLSPAQMKRIADALVAPHPFNAGDPWVLWLLSETVDPRIEAYLISELKREYAAPTLRWAETCMNTLASRMKLEASHPLLRRYRDLRGPGDEERRAVVKSFLELLEKN